MKLMNKTKFPKLNKETIGNTGKVLVATGTILKAGVEIAKALSKSKK